MKVIALIILMMVMACGSSTARPNERWVTVGDLSSVEWTEVSIECFNQLVLDSSVIGMYNNGAYLLQLVQITSDGE